MFRILIDGALSSLKVAKDAKSNNYADFIFMGGSVSVPVDSAMLEKLKPFEGKEVQFLLDCRARSVVLYERSVTLFEPIRVADVSPKK